MEVALYIIGAIVLIVILLVMFSPLNYAVSRSIVIDRPLNEVFNYLRFVKNQDHWSPWKNRDPDMKQTFQGVDGEVGFISSWEGNKQVGTGEQEIMKITENKRLDTNLRFLKPWKSESDAFIEVEGFEGGTQVTWGFTGTHKRPVNAMMLFMNMDKMVGRDFEEGLTKLKTILEQS